MRLVLAFILLFSASGAWAQNPIAIIGDGEAGYASSKVVYSNGDVYAITVNPNTGTGSWTFMFNTGPVQSAGSVPNYTALFWTWDGASVKVWHPSGSLTAQRGVAGCGGVLLAVGVAYFNGSEVATWGAWDSGKLGYAAPGFSTCFQGPVAPVAVERFSWGGIKARH